MRDTFPARGRRSTSPVGIADPRGALSGERETRAEACSPQRCVNSDAAIECYRALTGEAEADTCCKRICVMTRRMQRDGHSTEHYFHFMILANQLRAATNSFGPYIAEIYACMLEEDYDIAIQIREVMLQHESMLHEVASGKSPRHSATIN